MGTYHFDSKAGEPVSFQEQMINDFFKKQLVEFGLSVNNPNVSLENGIVTVTGEAEDQATREKIILALGNLQGVRSVNDEMTVAGTQEEALKPSDEPKFYTVKSGDTLSKIAKEFYGDAMKYPEIFQANKPMLVDPNKIYPGQVLRIPELN